MSLLAQRSLFVSVQRWPVAGTFTIARSSLTEIEVVVVELSAGEVVGRSECRPYPRYDEMTEGVVAAIEAQRSELESADEAGLLELCAGMGGGAAANAVESAVVDLICKVRDVPAWQWLDVPEPVAAVTAFTLSSAAPDAMARAAREASGYPLLKVKIGADAPLAQTRAVLAARPDARFIVDANEALDADGLVALCEACAGADVAMIEQPLPAGSHAALPDLIQSAPPVCADESLHMLADLPALKTAGYRAVNVKLDKAGGPIKARDLMRAAKSEGFEVMAGCMVGTSLAMAPMVVLSGLAEVLDLDGPLLLAEDCKHGLKYESARVFPPTPTLWG